MFREGRCVDCGTPLSGDRWAPGLCPHCSLQLALEIDSRELVSMEYIDGITLLDILKMRAPLDLSEAREIAAQFLAGLEAIHEAGLVHRDVKPGTS